MWLQILSKGSFHIQQQQFELQLHKKPSTHTFFFEMSKTPHSIRLHFHSLAMKLHPEYTQGGTFSLSLIRIRFLGLLSNSTTYHYHIFYCIFMEAT